ncbi:LmeA family phospholipid-binding protein [Leifsonia sp. 2MCAF36]|uniref:LmeA family phospholipid-binding protein n=1 Tax=Leifsonia sp. 2MCAF36 TaxID=3232988 RepID=UPI003F99E92E
MSDNTTQVLPAPPAPARRPRPRWLRLLLWIGIPVVAIVVLLVVVDSAARAYAEQRVSDEIEKNLPSDIQGQVSTHIGGFSVLQQYLSGTFQSVELTAPNVVAKGAPLSAKLVATDVPADFSKPISHATGTLSISQDSLNKLVQIPGTTGDITLGDGTIGYDGSIDLLGLPVGYAVTATPKAAGKQVLLSPDKASLKTGAGNVNLNRLLQALTSQGPFPVCAAQYLPDGVQVADIGVTPGHATVTLTASDFVMDQKFLNSKGSCS